MFKASQDIKLSENSGFSDFNGVYGIYRRVLSSENGGTVKWKKYVHNNEEKTTIITYDSSNQRTNENIVTTPSLAEVNQLEIINFPNDVISTSFETNFIIKKNGLQGNFLVELETAQNSKRFIPLRFLDEDKLLARIQPLDPGDYKVHVKFNSIPVNGSPFILKVQQINEVKLPVFNSNASLITCTGAGLQKIILSEKNEFFIDASKAGNNILFIGICGPRGQCDEVSIKHTGQNIYNITYQVHDAGEYIIAAKWGDDHIPGSPFMVKTIN